VRLFLEKNRRDSVQQLQLNLPSDEQIALNLAAKEQLVERMAEVMLAMITREREACDGGQSS
jgi:hypothetical protein